MTAASPPGPTTVLVRTVWSYWRYTHRLLAMVGDERTRSNVQNGSDSSGSSGTAETSRARRSVMRESSRASGVYVGQSVTSRVPGNSATTRSPSVTRYTGSAITVPITDV